MSMEDPHRRKLRSIADSKFKVPTAELVIKNIKDKFEGRVIGSMKKGVIRMDPLVKQVKSS